MIATPSLLQGLVALLAPPTCPGCELAHPGVTTGFCDACDPLLEAAPPWLTPPARAAAGWLYQGPLADAIKRFKYGGRGDLAGALGAMLAGAARAYHGEVDAIVPLPLHPAKLRARGFNPAALLARPVAAELGIPMRTRWLLRPRATRTQAGLDRDARLANVRHAFSAPPVRGQRVLLIDDVRTTGATLSEASKTLRTQGHEVITLALAWAEPD